MVVFWSMTIPTGRFWLQVSHNPLHALLFSHHGVAAPLPEIPGQPGRPGLVQFPAHHHPGPALQSVAHDGVLPVAGVGGDGDRAPPQGQGGLHVLLPQDDHLPANNRQWGQEQFQHLPGEAHEMAEDPPGQALPRLRG